MTEEAVKQWIEEQSPPKCLDFERFVKVCEWKTKRAKRFYHANSESRIVELTRRAWQASDDMDKLQCLTPLRGVSVALAATILHFLEPDRFPIFDYHARNTLASAGKWNRDKEDASAEAWQEYVATMRQLRDQLGVSLRTLDKALYAYDKWCRWCENHG